MATAHGASQAGPHSLLETEQPEKALGCATEGPSRVIPTPFLEPLPRFCQLLAIIANVPKNFKNGLIEVRMALRGWTNNYFEEM